MATTTQRRSKAYAPRMNPEERREQLLDAALTIIVRDGVHRVSIDAVAREAGVSRPVVYGIFDDTDALLRASLEREEHGALSQLAGLLPTPGVGKPADEAIATLDGFLRVVLEAPQRWRAIFQLADSSTPAFRRRVEGNRRAIVAHFENLVRWAMGEGLDANTDVELLARALYALLWEAGRLALAEPDDFPPERIVAFGSTLIREYFGQGGPVA